MRVCIVSASGQNVFFDELLGALGTALEEQGIHIESAVDHFPAVEEIHAYLFVPHEYLPLTQMEVHPTEAQLSRSVALCTEQPGTSYFEEGLRGATNAGAVIDINPAGVAELRRRGVAARRLQLGYVASWDHWHGDQTSTRPWDVIFLGGYTPRRGAALARCGHVLADHRPALYLTETRTPHTAKSSTFLSGATKWEHLANSKTIVNIHRSGLAYLEWQRIIEAMANGCVVVTEHSLGVTPLIPGEHYLSTAVEGLPATLRALLDDPGRLATIREAAYRTLRDELPLSASIHVLADALEEVSRASVSGVAHETPNPVPAPRELTHDPEYMKVLSEPRGLDTIRMALDDLAASQGVLERRLDAAPDATQRDQVETYASSAPAARVSVILTTRNRANWLGETIESVALSTLDSAELVVVDGASTDGSLDVARRELERYPWLPTTIVARPANGSIGDARNTGLEHARGEFVFFLDAGTTLYRHGLERLVLMLDHDREASLSYGLLEIFDSEGSRDLRNWLAWDPRELRFGYFVGGMAMIRRAALETVGCYPDDPRLSGWEDFALCCEFAERGWRGAQVREILGRKRYGMTPTTHAADRAPRSVWRELLDRYPVLTTDQ